MLTIARSVRPVPVPDTRWVLLGVMLGFSVLTGCSGDPPSEQRLPESTFTQVLTELQLAAVRQSQTSASPSGLRDSILAHYDVPTSDFDATLRYYSRHPKAFEALYQTVIDTLQALQYPEKGRTIPQGVPDSLYQKRRGEAEQ